MRAIYQRFPKNLSEPWDFPGYQCGSKNWDKEIQKVFLCLDFTEGCLEECRSFQPDLILTHHPFYFGNRKRILLRDPKREALEENINTLGCPLYSFHTNFDKAECGMNDTILQLLGGTREKVGEDGLMRLFSLPASTTMESLMQKICDVFHFEHLDYIGDKEQPISKATMIAGGGAQDYADPLVSESDVYLSGDCAHHTRLDMIRYGVSYIDMPHEVEEKGFLLGMQKALLAIDPTLKVDAFGFESYFSSFTSKK